MTCPICNQTTDKTKIKKYLSRQYEICYCQNCDLEFYRDLKETPTQYYQELYQDWSIEGISLRGLVWGHKQGLKLIKQRFKKQKVSLLDIGCAQGLFVKKAAKAGIQAWGIDINPDLVKIARKTHNCQTVYCANLQNLDQCLSQKFDIITLVDVLEHLPGPRQYLEQIKKHLKENGLVFISLPNRYCQPKFLPIGGDLPPHHLTWWSKKALFHALETAGYQVLKYQTEKVNPKDMAVWFDSWLDLRIKAFKNAKSLAQKTALQNKNKNLTKLIYLFKKAELDLLTVIFCLPARLLTLFGGKGTAHYILAQKS
ncbi:class I SAM-dependent methyltransferase [Candidatus Parcubacteria bacterium]|nr:class I SAM-dependent methyltransferase [Patescibacteria group bacterium]MBU4466990.1 class I SAM-dependent methyltransferase [Patescibacteria group bacterium]MCG2688307.1 class I SAM-dependent methyltransferase [Candidatus Parcubacteria bacterium]